MRIAVGSDHRGVEARVKLIELLEHLGQTVIDCGTNDPAQSVDYPDVGLKVALQVGRQEVDRGILICGTGLGMCIVANKVPHVRAALCHDIVTAELSRRHNDLNVLCLSAEIFTDKTAEMVLNTWLNTEFEGGRHARRLEKIDQLEKEGSICPVQVEK